jgi:hypothetical protein
VSAAAAEPTSNPLPVPLANAHAPDGTRGVRRHASEQDYRSWVYKYVPHQAVRWERLCAHRRFVEQWPDLRDWFAAPLPVRLGFEGGRVFATGRTAAHRAAGYLVYLLVYLALVRGVGLDADYLLAASTPGCSATPAAARAWAWTEHCSSRTWPGWLSSATRQPMHAHT